MRQTSGALLGLGARTTQQLILMEQLTHKAWCVSFTTKGVYYHTVLDY